MNSDESPNPYASPQSPHDPAIESRIQSLKWLRGAALGLICLASLQLMFAFGAIGISFTLVASAIGLLKPEEPQWILLLELAGCIAGLCRALPMLYGAIQMQNARRYRWAKIAAILGICGVFHPVLWLDVPFGIWAYTLLRKQKYKSLFQIGPAPNPAPLREAPRPPR